MNKVDVISNIFERNVGVHLNEAEYDLEFNQINNWDSLKHVQFIVDLELELNIQFTAEELEIGNSIKKIFEIINEK